MKSNDLYKEVNPTDPSPSVRLPWVSPSQAGEAMHVSANNIGGIVIGGRVL